MSQCEHRSFSLVDWGYRCNLCGFPVTNEQVEDVLLSLGTHPTKPRPMSNTTLRACGNRCVIQMLDEKTNMTAGGLYIPDTAQNKSQFGRVVALGPGVQCDDGSYLAPDEFKVGDKVVIAKYAGHEVTVDGEEFITLSISDVLAVVIEEEVPE